MEIVIIAKDGHFLEVSIDEALILCMQEGYRIATAHEVDVYLKGERQKTELREARN